MIEIFSNIKSRLFNSFPDIRYFVTKAYSEQIGNSDFNLSYHVGRERDGVDRNRRMLQESLGIGDGRLHFPEQCHTANIEMAKQGINQYQQTDALITNDKNICLAVLAADCVPILLFDPYQKAVAAIHAGWKGTAQKIVSNTIKKLVAEYDCRVENILAFIGPSICKECYQVGPEVISIFNNQGYGGEVMHKHDKEGKSFLDLWMINKKDLMNAGVRSINIECSGICTYQTKWLFSARRDGFHTGRFAAGIMVC